MRTLILTIGAPGSGKSTFIEKHGLKPYSLCADDIRLLCQGAILMPDGTTGISQKNDKTVWQFLFDCLERRMERGELTVIDACHSKSSDFAKYKDLATKYRYRIFGVDFRGVPIEVCKNQNKNRPAHKFVPENVLDLQYSRFQHQVVPNYVNVIKPEEFNTKILSAPMDYNKYYRIHVFGDVHACFSTLEYYLKTYGGIKDNEYYVFVGDYFDRGPQTEEMFNWLKENYNRPNVLLLTGNHEKWLNHWAFEEENSIKSSEFNSVARVILEKNKKENQAIARNICRKMGQMAFFEYDVRGVPTKFLATHGGISNFPDGDYRNLFKVATDQLINGVGKYSDDKLICDTWEYHQTHSTDPVIQIFGHRNVSNLPAMANKYVFNLQGDVEFGGFLRVVQIDSNGAFTIEIQNTIVRKDMSAERLEDTRAKKLETSPEAAATTPQINLDDSFKSNKNLFIQRQEGEFSNIVSVCHKKSVFYNKDWDSVKHVPRGLFINKSGSVVARGYTKFFAY